MEQYAFIYRALAEHFYFGDTDVPAENFCDYYARLRYIPRERKSSGTNGIKMTSIAVSYDQNGGGSPPTTITANQGATVSSVSAVLNAKVKQWKNGIQSFNKESKQSGLEREYEILFTVLEPVRTTSAAQKDENVAKNRFPDVVPFDRYRVMLIPRIGCSSSSQYINATPHRGYWQ
uniref:Tyrosine-protein phosphatase domain-containing protein n=1 Tax=Panagrolaimus sp. JU765 TaxID=591449 RepID=A0AC34R3W4_9BILA